MREKEEIEGEENIHRFGGKESGTEIQRCQGMLALVREFDAAVLHQNKTQMEG